MLLLPKGRRPLTLPAELSLYELELPSTASAQPSLTMLTQSLPLASPFDYSTGAGTDMSLSLPYFQARMSLHSLSIRASRRLGKSKSPII
jgi:hypothetical protein